MATPPSRPCPPVVALALALLTAAARAQGSPAPAAPADPPALDPAVQALCADHPKNCAGLQAALDQTKGVESDAKTCAAACGADALFALDGRLIAAGERARTELSHAGVANDGCSDVQDHGNVFYAKMQDAHAALAAAWAPTALGSPAGVPQDVMPAVAAANQVCKGAGKDGLICPLSRLVVLEAAEFENLRAQCLKNAASCPWDERKRLLGDFLLLQNHAFHMACLDKADKTVPAEVNAIAKDYFDASHVTDLVSGAVANNVKSAKDDEAKLASDISDMTNLVQIGDKGAASQTAVAALEKRLSDIGGGLTSKSLMVDQMNQALAGEKDKSGKLLTDTFTGPLRDQLNDENQQYVQLRANLKALRVMSGYSVQDVGAHDDAPFEKDPPSAPPPAPAKAAAPGTAAAPPAARPLDKTAVPAAAPVPVAAPPILNAPLTDAQIVKNLTSADPTTQADAYRRAHLTYTAGDPGRRAALAYRQDSPDTCGLVAQQEVLRAYGRVPATDPAQQQKTLRDEAAEAGIFGNGTPSDLSGALLEKHWLQTKVRYHAPISELDQAVKTGDFVIASVDARPLWGLVKQLHTDNHAGFSNDHALPHNILITGAEVTKVGGAVVGYYVNDSGELTGFNSYFVPASVFAQAWNGNTQTFVEVLR